MSFYRPSYGGPPYDDAPPPPPPPDMPPLPPGPPPPFDSYRGGDSWRPHSSLERDFTFRNPDSASGYPDQRHSYRPASQHSAPNRPRQVSRHDNQNLNRSRRGGFARGGRARHATSARPLLKQQHGGDESGLEMLGVTEGATRYFNTGDLDDSEEEEMDQSDSDREQGEIGSLGADGTMDEDTGERPAKRLDSGQRDESAATQPRWSNPDPYSVLPPIDETLSKRKDPVQTIRKYKKTKETAVSVNQVAANDDFISFNILDESLDDSDDFPSVEGSDNEGDSRVPGAPTGPRALQTKQNGQHSSGRYPVSFQNYRKTPTDEIQHHLPLNSGPVPAKKSNHQQMTTRPLSPRPPDRIVLDTIDEANHEPPDLTNSYSESLGSRKRAYDDQIKGGARRAPGRSSLCLLDEWLPDRGVDPIPWLNKSEHMTTQSGLRLHKEIADFFEFVRPQRFEEIVREELLNRLRSVIRKEYPNCDVHCFGSFAAGLYLPNADMDVVVITDGFRYRGEKTLCQTNNKLRKFGDYIRQSGLAQAESVEVIASAKVPIIKLVDRVTSIKIDVSFENDSGLAAIDTFHAWKRQFPAMPVLVTLIKQFLMMRGLNEVQYGGLGGFSVTCLVTSLLQHIPRVQTGQLRPEEHLGEMLIEFLDFYGCRLDISRTGITMNPPGYFDKYAFNRTRNKSTVYKPSQLDRIAIMDPNNIHHDISGGSGKVSTIFAHFARAHSQIMAAIKAEDRPSLLDWMLGGNYESFAWQRNHLRELYNERYARVYDRKPELQKKVLPQSGIVAMATKYSEDPSNAGLSGIHLQAEPQTLDLDSWTSNLETPQPKPAREPQRSLTEAEKKEFAAQTARANELRRQYPDMPNIPGRISRKDFAALIQSYHATHWGKTAHINESELSRSDKYIAQKKNRSQLLQAAYPWAKERIPEKLDQQNYKRLAMDFQKEMSRPIPPSQDRLTHENIAAKYGRRSEKGPRKALHLSSSARPRVVSGFTPINAGDLVKLPSHKPPSWALTAAQKHHDVIDLTSTGTSRAEAIALD